MWTARLLAVTTSFARSTSQSGWCATSSTSAPLPIRYPDCISINFEQNASEILKAYTIYNRDILLYCSMVVTFSTIFSCIPPLKKPWLQAVERAAGSEGQKITYNIIKQRLSDIIYRIVYVSYPLLTTYVICHIHSISSIVLTYYICFVW